MKSISEAFTNMPPAAMAAHEAGKRRMEARLARVTAHAELPQPVPAPVATADHAGVREARAALHRERLVGAAVVNAVELGLDVKIVDRLLNDGVSPTNLGAELVRAYAQAKSKDSFTMLHTDSGSRVVSSHDDPANILEAMSDAIAYHALKALNPSHKLPDNGARDYMSFSGADYARECVARSTGRPASSMHLTRVVGEALGNTTSDFPNLLGTAANKVLMGSYEAAAPTYRYVFAQQNVNNFLPHSMVRSGDFPALLRSMNRVKSPAEACRNLRKLPHSNLMAAHSESQGRR